MGVFAFLLEGDLPTMTTSSAILMQVNFTFLPYSVECFTKYVISAMIIAACFKILRHFFCDVDDSRKQVVGLIYTKLFVS